ncbi:MAG: magnesium transporter [Candidatus Omnitrophota bacterium]|nr:magnesium transporter [Candidatus Omnitrophota bacterium]MDZ4243249.1 magnesium transporter [Candidatus Omnitrophota bacterium]
MKSGKPLEYWLELKSLIRQEDADDLHSFLKGISPVETARAVSKLDEMSRQKLLELLNPPDAADLLQDLPEEQAADMIGKMEPEDAAAIMDQISGSEQADILADVGDSTAEAILEAMPTEDAAVTRQLMTYPADTAGGLMNTEFLSYPEEYTVRQVIEDLQNNSRRYTDYHVQYAYVTAQSGVLLGVLRIRDLPLNPPETPVKSIMNVKPVHVKADSSLSELLQIFEEYSFLGIPVVGEGGVLAGVIRRDDVMAAAGDRDKNSFLKMSGIIGGEELRSMPLRLRSGRRLSWLVINIFLNLVSASVIAFYQETLAAVIALAVFLPIISDMSGSSGSQALAVSIRELTLGLVRPFEIAQVVLKEIGIGLVNGVILGGLLGLVALFWKGNFYLGIVVGGALAINTVVAVCVGGALPLILKMFRMDPALASGLILTTITDMCGFFFALYFATAMLPLLS